MLVNHKRVARIMREDNLLAVQPRAFVVTTDSKHKLEVYLNLAGRMKLTGINQLWVADITYIRLHSEFVYLAVILDAYWPARWWASGSWTERWPRAVAHGGVGESDRGAERPPPGLVHHSDRGVQYASGEYRKDLAEAANDSEHEPHGEPLRQRQLQKVSHEDSKNEKRSTRTNTGIWITCASTSKSFIERY